MLEDKAVVAGESVLRSVEIERPQRSIDGERLLAVFSQIIEPLGRALPASSELVLHDLSLIPNSIVALYGDVTGRRVGDPATNVLLKQLVDGGLQGAEAYETELPDGRRIRSTTVLIHDVSGNPVAALCVNTDLTMWASLQHLTETMVGGLSEHSERSPAPQPAPAGVQEQFVRSVEDLSRHLIDAAIESVGLPVDLMKKRHKLEVVRELRAGGMFLLRDGVDIVAQSLQVSRFTIYNYLNEIESGEAKSATP